MLRYWMWSYEDVFRLSLLRCHAGQAGTTGDSGCPHQGAIHGYRLAERINEVSSQFGEKPDVSGIYRFLKRMETTGLVTSVGKPEPRDMPNGCSEITRTAGLLGPMDHDLGSLLESDRSPLEGAEGGDGA